MPSSVEIVRFMRAASSRREMMPSRSAATALHMYAPMLVVDVCTSRSPPAWSWSVGSPLCSSVIATNDCHVPRA